MEKLSIKYKYEPTKMQAMLHSDGTRFKVVVVGRRSGKSMYAFNEAVATCLEEPNRKVWILVPTYPQARDVYWRGSDITRYLTKEMYKKKNDVELMIEFHNGSVLQLKSAERPESLRGSGLDLLIWDEVASTRYAKMIWDEILLPSLSDKMGRAVLIGCVVGSTRILTDHGIRSIDEYIKEEKYSELDERVYGLNKEYHTADGFWDNGVHPTIKVKTRRGFALEGTTNHPIWTKQKEWKELDNLRIGDKVAIDYGMEIWGNKNILDGWNFKQKDKRGFTNGYYNFELDNDLCYLLGVMLAEGYTDRKDAKTVITCGDKLRLPYRFKNRKGRLDQYAFTSREFVSLLEYIKFPICLARNKYLPKFLWDLNREQVRHFLGGYFDGDGHTRRNRFELGFTSSSESLIKDLQLLCTNFGAIGTITYRRTMPTKKVKVESDCFQLIFNGRDYDKVVEFIKPRIKRKINKILDLKRIRRVTIRDDRSDYFYDTITSLEKSEAHTYDFTVPDTHSFWSNGFISHNTPKGYNFFFDLFQYAQSGQEDWKAWQIPTKDSGNYWTLTKDGQNELKRLEETMSEDAYCQEYGADFRKHTGLVFKEFEREIHVRNFEVKTKFPLEIGQDFGYTNPTAVVFSYFDEDDNWYIFDEYYWANRTIFEHAGSIRAQRERYPNSMKAIYGDSEDSSAIAEYSRYGWFITPTIKDKKSVVTGIDRIIERLKINPVTKNPKLFIHPNCVNLIKEIERYRWKERRADSDQDEPEKEFDHLMDAMRYVILMHYKHKTNFISPARFSYIPTGANIKTKKKSMWDYKP